jgi:hypothetical protein
MLVRRSSTKGKSSHNKSQGSTIQQDVDQGPIAIPPQERGQQLQVHNITNQQQPAKATPSARTTLHNKVAPTTQQEAEAEVEAPSSKGSFTASSTTKTQSTQPKIARKQRKPKIEWPEPLRQTTREPSLTPTNHPLHNHTHTTACTIKTNTHTTPSTNRTTMMLSPSGHTYNTKKDYPYHPLSHNKQTNNTTNHPLRHRSKKNSSTHLSGESST